MFEVILYAAIATIVCVMLYTVLGKSVGQGPEEAVDLFKPNTVDAPKIVEPISERSDIEGMNAVIALDSSFNTNEFINGAKSAYVMILEAFASGDRDTLENLLTEDVYKVYSDAIDAREADNLTQITDLGRLISASISRGEVDGRWMSVSVAYKSEIASALQDEDGEIVQGDPDVLASIEEVWTYTRKAGASDPNWRLSDVAASEGDELEADPTPDTKA